MIRIVWEAGKCEQSESKGNFQDMIVTLTLSLAFFLWANELMLFGQKG
jgi:hypothetical protein